MPRLTKTAFAAKEDISVPILDSWIYRHGLPVIQIGRRIYIDQSDFEAWLKEHKKVVNEKPPVRSMEVVLPKQCRKSSIASKIRRIY
ncbi:helix-turn-helix domain-containing protein [Sporomusa acidovorans]|uniref:helix-turn-helix domain-containing protein n=1 Tax=Sporomusa acidovorans TaxID=112900 RepID=UPI000B8A22A6